MGCAYFMFVILLAFARNATPKPIMVSFGTNQGPIVPPPPTTTYLPPIQERRAPAPVSERAEDIPNPSVYKPYVPIQYRTKLLSFKPNPNLIIGTAQDQKYYASSQKFSQYKREQARALGLDYRGPQFFERQAYELDKFKQPAVRGAQLFQPNQQPFDVASQQKEVPQIGVIYSSGVKYYVPQVLYYLNNNANLWNQNSVYEKNDNKFVYYNNQV